MDNNSLNGIEKEIMVPALEKEIDKDSKLCNSSKFRPPVFPILLMCSYPYFYAGFRYASHHYASSCTWALGICVVIMIINLFGDCLRAI